MCDAARAAPSTFRFLYPDEIALKEKIETISKEIYGAETVEYDESVEEALAYFEAQGWGNLPMCMAKTHLSLSTDPALKGVPTGFTVRVREVRASVGAGFIFPLLGPIMTIPGLPTRPAFYEIDIDPETGKIVGLF
jgi:formyltetrahydrofolate synthetase